MTLNTQFWRAAGPLNLRWKCWQDEYIVFNVDSGDVLLLNPVATEALKILETSPTSLDELTEQIARRLDVDLNEDLHQGITQFVYKLAHLGMVCPIDETL